MTTTEINQMTFDARVDLTVPGDEASPVLSSARMPQVVWLGVVEQTSFDALAKFLGVMTSAYGAATSIMISDYDAKRRQAIQWASDTGYTYHGETGEAAILAWAEAFNARPEHESFNS